MSNEGKYTISSQPFKEFEEKVNFCLGNENDQHRRVFFTALRVTMPKEVDACNASIENPDQKSSWTIPFRINFGIQQAPGTY